MESINLEDSSEADLEETIQAELIINPGLMINCRSLYSPNTSCDSEKDDACDEFDSIDLSDDNKKISRYGTVSSDLFADGNGGLCRKLSSGKDSQASTQSNSLETPTPETPTAETPLFSKNLTPSKPFVKYDFKSKDGQCMFKKLYKSDTLELVTDQSGGLFRHCPKMNGL